MKVILLANVPKLGKKNDIKNVSDGHALNMLIPKGLVEVATDAAIKKLETRKTQEAGAQKRTEDAIAKNLATISGKVYEIKENVNEKGHLFAAITAADISKLIKDESSVELPAEYIMLEKPIKDAGEHRIKIQVGEAFASITVTISAK